MPHIKEPLSIRKRISYFTEHKPTHSRNVPKQRQVKKKKTSKNRYLPTSGKKNQGIAQNRDKIGKSKYHSFKKKRMPSNKRTEKKFYKVNHLK